MKPQRKTNCAALITMDSLSFVPWLIFTIVLPKCLIWNVQITSTSASTTTLIFANISTCCTRLHKVITYSSLRQVIDIRKISHKLGTMDNIVTDYLGNTTENCAQRGAVCCYFVGCSWTRWSVLVDANGRSVTMRARVGYRSCHVVEKFCHVVIGNGGECFSFVEFGIYLLKCSIFLSDSRTWIMLR